MSTARVQPRPFAASLHVQYAPAGDPASTCACLELHGEVDSTASPWLQAEFDKALQARPAGIVLNLADVDYMNSTGIALIVGLLAQAQQARTPLYACGLSEHYQEIFQITALAGFIHVIPTEAEAAAAAFAENLALRFAEDERHREPQ